MDKRQRHPFIPDSPQMKTWGSPNKHQNHNDVQKTMAQAPDQVNSSKMANAQNHQFIVRIGSTPEPKETFE